MDVPVSSCRLVRQDRGVVSQPHPRRSGCQSVLPEGSQASWRTENDHAGRVRAEPRGIASHGDAERVQLPMGESSQDPIIEISKQHGGTRSPAHQVPFTTYAGLQVVLQCTPCADRRRTASENQQEPVSCSRRIRSYWCCYMEQHSCQLIHASIRVA